MEPASRDPSGWRHRHLIRTASGVGVLLLAAVASCTRDVGESWTAGIEPPRSSRFGALSDLVLINRSEAQGGAYWLDQFETTRGDWRFYEARVRPAERVIRSMDRPESLPVSKIDWFQASAYARWRFGRLPRFDEWRFVARGQSDYRWPWGDQENHSWANTGNLQVFQLLPVGTFESGRQRGGPYDLVGNVGEWTLTTCPSDGIAFETDNPNWSQTGSLGRRFDALRVSSCLRVWTRHIGLGVMVPPSWLLRVESLSSPRVVCGHYARPMDLQEQVWVRRPHESGGTTGLRLATDPDTFLWLLLSESAMPVGRDLGAVERFLTKPEHRALFRAAWSRLEAWRDMPPARVPELHAWVKERVGR